MKTALVVLFVIIAIWSCEKNNSSNKANAEILTFHPEKCSCCWGWDIKIGKDTIRSDDGIIGDLVGYNFVNPLPVYIELGDKKEPCTAFSNHFDIYKIKKIQKLN